MELSRLGAKDPDNDTTYQDGWVERRSRSPDARVTLG